MRKGLNPALVLIATDDKEAGLDSIKRRPRVMLALAALIALVVVTTASGAAGRPVQEIVVGQARKRRRGKMHRRKEGGSRVLYLASLFAVGLVSYAQPALAALPAEPAYRAPQIGVGQFPQGIASADFDGDGDRDVAVANAGSDTVTVLRNAGGGVLSELPPIASTGEPRALAAGDLDRDGATDLLVGHRSSAVLSVFRGRGDGTFSPAAAYAVPEGAADIAVADLDGDGALDVVLAALASDGLLVFLNDGGGALRAPASWPLTASGVAVGDLNRDGRLDLAVSLATPSEARTLLGNGDGSFSPGERIATPALAWKIALGDIDGDGDLDLATVNFTEVLAETATLARNRGDGRFAPASNHPVGGSPFAIAAGDLEGDGRAEFVTANGEGGGTRHGTIGIVSSAGPAAVLVRRLDGPRAAAGAALAPMDAGPLLDVIVASGDQCRAPGCTAPPGQLTVLLNTGGDVGGYSVYDTSSATAGPCAGGYERDRSLAADDLTGDGHVDLAVARCETSDVELLANDGSGGFLSMGVVARGERAARAVATGDVDRDGDVDLVVAYHIDAVALHRNRGDGTFAAPEDIGSTVRHPFLAVVDMNGDGALDVVLGYEFSGGTVVVLVNDGRGGFSEASMTRLEPGSLGDFVFAVGDLDGDGDTDVVAGADRSGAVTVLLNDGTGTLSALSPLVLDAAEPRGIAVGDVDGDGDVDAAVADPSSNEVRLLVNTGGGTLVAGAAMRAGDEVAGIALADVDGDGRVDLVHAQPQASAHPHENATVRLNDGGGFGDPVSYLGGIGSSAVLVAQLNRAGGPELVIADERLGRLWVHTSGVGGLFADLDADLVPDVFEPGLFLDPLDRDSDDDGLPDGVDPDLQRGALGRLPSPAFLEPGHRQALLDQMRPLEPLISNGKREEAVKRLDAIGRRYDGCRAGQGPDGDDWVVDCAAQATLALPHAILSSNLRGVPPPKEFLPPPVPREPVTVKVGARNMNAVVIAD